MDNIFITENTFSKSNMKYYTCKDLLGNTIFVPSDDIKIVEHLRILICNKKPHIEPYNIKICMGGRFLTQFDRLQTSVPIHIFQKYHSGKSYNVSDVFDALYQIHGVIYNLESNTDNDSDSDSFFSIDSQESD